MGMISLICFHDLAVEIQLGVLAVLFLMALRLLSLKGFWAFGLDRHQVEFLWTVVPFVLILLFSIPSLITLYLQASSAELSTSWSREERACAADWNATLYKLEHVFGVNIKGIFKPANLSTNPDTPQTVVVTGRQWYWDYRTTVASVNSISFNVSASSHILNTPGVFHMFLLDQWLYLFCTEAYNVAVTSGDVLHSFAIPSLGIKIDAVPGKDNIVSLSPVTPGLFFGNCSEICGVNHTVIPIGLVVGKTLFF